MVGTAIASFFGMLAISTIYGLAHAFIAKSLSEKISQAWAHRSARFMILVIIAIQGISAFILYGS